jgi:solute carrier family 39 (zinc transporter), member 9
MTLSPSQLRLISTIGMGVLVGTSLIVIIPEGIEAIYEAGSGGHSHLGRSLHTPGNGIAMRWAPTILSRPEGQLHRPREAGHINTFDYSPDIATRQTIETDKEETIPSTTDDDIATPETEEAPSPEDIDGPSPPTFYIGLSLILGFVLMLLIDKLSKHASDNLQSPPQTRHISLDNLSQGLHSTSSTTLEDGGSESFLQSLAPTPKHSRSLATTTGLVIHAAADGIAMGASISSSSKSLGFIVFIAILIHKAPAAFGLTSVLLKQGLSKRVARSHLIIFSLASPLGALTTFLLINILGGSITGETGQWWTGMLLLFSGGTFL